MLEKISGIVIDIVRHNDRNNVVTLFTRSRGRIAFLSPIGKGRSAAVKKARIAPLAWLDADINFRATRSLQVLSSINLHTVWHSMYFDPVKSSLIFFIAEFLNRLMRVNAPDIDMFDYIVESLAFLDETEESVSNFHLAFLAGLLAHSGIMPMIDDWKPGFILDMRAGTVISERPAHHDYLSAEDTALFKDILSMTCRDSSSISLSGTERSHILQFILKYYSVHLPGIVPLKSLEVLKTLFH